jgi:uncharacterized membrane protein YgaE (UPF0421/DUF939 family)|tara:strand:+ start:59 stop:358 length:300 start_codon:yes stop_codon:yes gene_type:complete
MSENITTIIISLITVLFGGGAWKFYEFIIKKKSDDKKVEMSEKTMYRDDLKKRVSKLEDDKEECMKSLMEISKSLSSLEAKVEYLEKENNELKIRLQNK